MTRSYRHLTFEERCQVKIPKMSGLSKGSIAQHPSLITVRTTPSLELGPGVALQIESGVIILGASSIILRHVILRFCCFQQQSILTFWYHSIINCLDFWVGCRILRLN